MIFAFFLALCSGIAAFALFLQQREDCRKLQAELKDAREQLEGANTVLDEYQEEMNLWRVRASSWEEIANWPCCELRERSIPGLPIAAVPPSQFPPKGDKQFLRDCGIQEGE